MINDTYTPGDLVRVTEGPLKGRDGIVRSAYVSDRTVEIAHMSGADRVREDMLVERVSVTPEQFRASYE